MTDAHASERSIFLAALERGSAQERAAYLEEACAGDPRLRADVEALLAAHARLGELPPAPAASDPSGTQAELSSPEGPGTWIGPYKLLQALGEGGMGTVYLAKQQEPVQRRVALKIIKAGLASAHVLGRFEQERQALALMDHPNIAKVFDAGTVGQAFRPDSPPPSQAGKPDLQCRPYFVMELVKGIPITTFCDQEQLTPRERLELLVPVCQAVQHAHQKGIIHRDLKPSNVLIALYDGKPVPKVIDFGVAKATGPKLTERTLFTEVGQMVGTLEYMAPEQAELNNLDIDTRADIYALGVILYELLTGSPPFTGRQLRSAAFAEMLRIIREVEPPKPSTKLSGSAELAGIAAKRKLEPKKLTRLVQGELDWIVMKCLEKERQRRYETANGLALDLQRYLADEPVAAGPPSAWYRLRKFVRRNKGRVMAAVTMWLLLVGGIIGTSLGIVQARHAAAEERLAKDVAQRRLQQVEKANELLASVFHNLGPSTEDREGKSLRVLLGERLEDTVRQLEGEAVGDTVTVARLQLPLGHSLMQLSQLDQAQVVLEKAYQTLKTSLGSEHPDTLNSMAHVAKLYHLRGRYDDAEALFKQVLEGYRQVAGPDDAFMLATMLSYADLCQERTRFDDAEGLLKQVVDGYRRLYGPNHRATLDSIHTLARLYEDRGRFDEAEDLCQQVLGAYRRQLGPNHLDTLDCMECLARIYRARGRHDDAVTLFKQVLECFRHKLGPEHGSTLGTMANLALVYKDRGRLDEAEPLLKQVLDAYRRKLGPDHPNTLVSMDNLGGVYLARGRYDAAEPLFKAALEGYRRQLGPDHHGTLTSMNNLALLYYQRGRYDDAEPLFKDVLEGQRRQLGPEHPHTLITMNNLALVYHGHGRYDDAEKLLREIWEVRRQTLGPDHPQTLLGLYNLASVYGTMKKWDQSIPLLEECLGLQKAKLGLDDPETLMTLAKLGENYCDAGRREEGIRCLKDALDRALKRPGPLPSRLAWVPGALAQAYDQANQSAKAEELFRQLVERTRQEAGVDARETTGALINLGLNLLHQKKYAEAEATLRECLQVRERKWPDDWMTFNVRSLLGEGLVGQRKYAEAEPLLVQGYEGMRQRAAKMPAHRDDRLAEAVERLVQLYDAWGKQDEAQKWRATAEALKTSKDPKNLEPGRRPKRNGESSDQQRGRCWSDVSRARTGPVSPQRLVCAPGAMAFNRIADRPGGGTLARVPCRSED
jgi:serine/threonine protein kinase/Flp pilus assembly protein TadD